MSLTIQTILKADARRLQAALDLDAAAGRIEAQCLLQAVLQVHRAHLLAYPEQVLNPQQQTRYHAMLERRLGGEPLAYILGEREFYGLNFKVTPATLIPRADTELLVDLALQRIPQTLPAPAGEGSLRRVLDLGTGSGAIALSIACARPEISVTAVDASEDALQVARENAHHLSIRNVRLLHSDWFAALPQERFDLIVSNPPYIAAGDAHLERGDLRFEPASALASGADGLDATRQIIGQAASHLTANGGLLLEHGYNQAAAVRDLLRQAGFVAVFSEQDLAGVARVSGGRINAHK